MKVLTSTFAVMMLGAILTVSSVASLSAAPGYGFQDYGEPSGLRGLIDRSQSDLRQASELEHNNGKEHERYRDAQHNLSTLDRHLTKGHLDKGQLNKSIGDIQGILDHNTLQASSRDALLRDVEDLRMARERYHH